MGILKLDLDGLTNEVSRIQSLFDNTSISMYHMLREPREVTFLSISNEGDRITNTAGCWGLYHFHQQTNYEIIRQWLIDVWSNIKTMNEKTNSTQYTLVDIWIG